MNYKVQLTTEAEDDIRSIFEYIAFTLHSVQNAVGQIDRLEKSMSSLRQMPERFRSYEKEPWHSRNLHIMPVNNYLIFYVPDDKDQTVTVIRIMYSRRDIDSQLDSLL